MFAALTHCVKVGKFFGIAVRIHWSFWALPLGLAVVSLPQGWRFAGQLVLLVLVFYAQGVVLHEYGHALAARLFRVRTRDIILTPIGGIARMEEMPENPVHEIVIALAGPAVNVLFAVPTFIAFVLFGVELSPSMRYDPPLFSAWTDFVWALVFLNVGMAAFNLLPAFPSDGGRVFRAILSLFFSRLTATQVAVYTGAVVALGIALVGVANQAIQLPFIALLFATIGQMELWMVRRQEEMRRRSRTQSASIGPAQAHDFDPPEPNFSGYSWDDRGAAWVEWRNGVAVRRCRMRVE